MLEPEHQAAVIETMQQVIDRLPTQAHAEFLLQDTGTSCQRKVRSHPRGEPVLEAVSEPRHIRRGQAGLASVVGPLLRAARPPWL